MFISPLFINFYILIIKKEGKINSEYYHTVMVMLTTLEVKEVFRIQELVGTCSVCHKNVYCLDGFLNGVISEAKELFCNECSDEDKKDSPSKS
jgi:hypothetical protein